MSGLSDEPWSDNPYAPKLLQWQYFVEKVYFAGFLIGAIFYGIVIVLFFQCMGALLDPINRARGGIKWGLVAHTTAMFSFVTIYTAITLNIQSISFIDNREFPGTTDDVAIPPGPVGYQWSIHYKPISIATSPFAVMNNWLADGLLLYRCYVVYAMSYCVIAFPCLVYIACVATGIMFLYQTAQPESVVVILNSVVRFGGPYFFISFSLNILLTSMIVTRLILHRRNIRKAMGATAGAGGLYKTIVTVLIESSTIYALSFLLYVGPWAAKHPLQYIFMQILAQTQVISTFLITLRVADRRALAGSTITSGTTTSIRFSNQGKSTSGRETPPGVYPVGSTNAGELGGGIETAIELRPSKASDSEGSFKV